jgi:hypothetical protein
LFVHDCVNLNELCEAAVANAQSVTLITIQYSGE